MSVSVERWGVLSDQREVLLYTVVNAAGLSFKVTSLGASLVEVNVPDRTGKMANVNVRHEKAEHYEQNPASLGAICGRYAGRIKGARFKLDGVEHQLVANNAGNAIHGGVKGFNKRLWTSSPTAAGDGVTFRYRSLDGEEGYPGNFDVSVTYRLTNDNALFMEYEASTDRPTVLNLTNHAYWNLGGMGSGTVYEHDLQIHGEHYLLADDGDMVTGEIRPVADTAFDFTVSRPIGLHIGETARGFDHCYLLRGQKGQLRPAALVRHPATGRVMEVLTTEPAVQFYTANYFKPEVTPHQPKHSALCLECQHCPDAPNQPAFPSTVLRPGQAYRQTTVHRFSVES